MIFIADFLKIKYITLPCRSHIIEPNKHFIISKRYCLLGNKPLVDHSRSQIVALKHTDSRKERFANVNI